MTIENPHFDCKSIRDAVLLGNLPNSTTASAHMVDPFLHRHVKVNLPQRNGVVKDIKA